MIAKDGASVYPQTDVQQRQRPQGQPRADIDRLKPDIETYIGGLVSLKRQGRLLVACCPFHDEKTPSFKVDPRAQTWRCYGACGIGGDVIDFMKRYHGLSTAEVLQELAGTAARAARPAVRRLEHTSSADEPPPTAWQRAARAAATRAHEFLRHSDHPQARATRDYLHNRGITDALIEKYGIGYNPQWQDMGLEDDTGKIALARGITIPIEAEGQLWNVKTRRHVGDFAAALHITDTHKDGTPVDKYIGLRGHRTGIPFGADRLESGRDVLVVEGEFDAIVAQAALPQVTVITVGSASTPIKRRFLERLKTAGQIYTLFDNDAAGKKAKPLEQLAALGSKPLTLPQGVKDPTAFLQQDGDLAAWYRASTRQTGWWEGDLPSAVGEILRDALPDGSSAKRCEKIARLLNSAINSGLIAAEGFTVKDVIAAAEILQVQLSPRTIARGLEELALKDLFLSKVGSTGSIPPNFDKNSTGRRAIVYHAQPEAVIRANLLQLARRYLAEKHTGEKTLARFTPEMLAALTGEPNRELAAAVMHAIEPAHQRQSWQREQAIKRFNADYERLAAGLESPRILQLEPIWATYDPCAAKARAIIRETAGKPISQKQLARELNCAESYVPKIMDRAGIESSPNFGEFPIQPTADLAKEIRRISYQHKGKVFELKAKEGERYVESRCLSQVDSQWVNAQRAQGRQIVARTRLANSYYLVLKEPAEPEPKARREPVPHYCTRTPKAPRLTLKHDYRQGYNPRWVFGQLVLAVELVTGYHAHHSEGSTLLIDRPTGEIMRRIKDYRDLLAILGLRAADVAQQAHIGRDFDEFRPIRG